MRNQFHYYILFRCAAAFHASVPILRAFRPAILGAKAALPMVICNTLPQQKIRELYTCWLKTPQSGHEDNNHEIIS